MTQKQSKHGIARVWSALGALAIMAAWLAGGVCALAAEPPATARVWTGAASANWADGNNWSGGAVPGAAHDVVIDGGKCQPLLDLTNGSVTIKSLTIGKTVASTLTFTNGNVTDRILIVKGAVTVGKNGVLTHAKETAAGKSVGDETQRLCLKIGGNLTIGAGGAIRVAGCGYAKSAGPYKAASSSGGVHGGEGGFGKVGGTTTPTYGSVPSPVTAGSGSAFCVGGGVAVIRAAGRVTVDGVIDAAGGSGQGGGGAGGTVNIRAGELLGKGTISAKGGDGVQNNGGGGAGGGRIAVVLTKAATFGSITMSAAGGAGGTKHWGYGGAGTIYLQGARQASGQLIVSNPALTGVAGARTLIGPEVTGAVTGNVRVLDRARYVMTRDTTVVLDNKSLWRHFELQRCAYVRTDDGKLETLGPATADRLQTYLAEGRSKARSFDRAFHAASAGMGRPGHGRQRLAARPLAQADSWREEWWSRGLVASPVARRRNGCDPRARQVRNQESRGGEIVSPLRGLSGRCRGLCQRQGSAPPPCAGR